MKYTAHPYQQHATEHVLRHPACGLFLDMGLGKTVSTLTAIDHMLNVTREVSKVLVIAPKRVAEDTWTTECAKWDHLNHLTISKVLGSEKERCAALQKSADIYVINRENVPWLVARYGTAFPFDTVVIDELSSFKSAKSARFKALRQIRPKIRRVIGLTGTPAPNTLLDLWPQMYLLDQGQRLFPSLPQYREKYFKPDKRNGHIIHSYKRRGFEKHEKALEDLLGADIFEKEIFDRVSDICISMKKEDYLDLPPCLTSITSVHLPPDVMAAYRHFEKTEVLKIVETGEAVSAVNAAALTNKLLQFAGGAIYDEEKNVHVIHDVKLEALEERVEAANGRPMLVAYWFKHERDRILQRLKSYKPRQLESTGDIADWNAKKIPVFLLHPMSAGHGLNLQHGGNLLEWFGSTWSLELRQQMDARLYRQGITEPVFINSLTTVGTQDEVAAAALERKDIGQNALMNALKVLIAKYTS